MVCEGEVGGGEADRCQLSNKAPEAPRAAGEMTRKRWEHARSWRELARADNSVDGGQQVG